MKRTVTYRAFHKRLLKHIEDEAPDVILAATGMIPVAAQLGKRFGIKVGAFVRAYENFPGEKASAKSWKISSVIGKALLGARSDYTLEQVDFCLPNSEFMAEQVTNACGGAGDPRGKVVYPPVDIPLIEAESKTTIESVFMVGTTKKKGTETFRKLATEFSHLTFTIAGNPEIYGDEQLPRNLKVRGWVSDVAGEIGNHDLVLVPSQWQEPFGRIAVEALRLGKIVLVSDRGGLPETVCYQDDLIVRDECSSWVSRITDVLASPDKYSRLVDQVGKASVQFSTDVQAQKLIEILDQESRRG